jgi:hypothetical protein
MARKQQSAVSASRPSTPIGLIAKRLDSIRTRRLALEAQINEIEARFLTLKEEHQLLTEAQPAPQSRRKLRYPKS